MFPYSKQMSTEDINKEDVGVQSDPVSVIDCSQCGCEIDVRGLAPFIKVECPDCGHVENVPTRLGAFLLLEPIGKGGMGGVFLGRDASLGRLVAIKVMLKSLGADREFGETFRREAQAIARLNHPHIVQIYSFGQEKGQPYIVMELVSGKRFDKLVDGGRPLDEGLVMQVGLHIATALSAADEVGLIHGDIKPENILLDEKMHAKLVDFGLASFRNQAQGDGIWGTPYYIAPEKVRRQKVGPQADMYSLGATLYHALAGRPPFEGETPIDVVKARLDKMPPTLHSIRRNIDPTVEAAITRMLQPQPSLRHPNYVSLINDLRRAVQTANPLDRRTNNLRPPSGRMRVSRRRTGAIPRESGSVPRPPSGGGTTGPRKTITTKARKTVVAKPKKTIRTIPSKRTIVAGAAGAADAATANSEGENQPDALSSYKKRVLQGGGGTGGHNGPRKERSAKPVIAFLIVLLLGILAGGAIAIKVNIDKKNQQRANIYLTKANKKNANKLFLEISGNVSNIVKTADATITLMDEGAKAYRVVTGRRYRPPAAKKPAKRTTKASRPTRKSTLSSRRRKKQPARDSSMPEGIVSPEQLRAQREGTSRRKKPPKPAEPAAKEETVEAPPPPPAVDPDRPKDDKTLVSEHVKQLALYVEKAKEFRTKSLDRLATLRAANRAAQTARPDDPLTPGNSIAEMNKYKEQLIQWKDSTAKNLTGAQKYAKLADEIRVKVENDRKEEKQRQEDLAKEQADEEQKRREEEAYGQKTDAEKEMAENARLALKEMLQKNQFEQAVESLKTQAGQYETTGGKEAFAVVTRRYDLMAELKGAMIKKLNKDGYPWGWLIQGRPQKDIENASSKGVTISGGQKVPWEKVGPRQLLKIMNYVVEKSSASPRRVANLQLGIAIYYLENDAQDQAKKALGMALETFFEIQKDAKRLLPEDLF